MLLRALSRSDQALAATLAILLLCALLPLRFLGWTNRLAEVLALPLTPLTHMGISVASWLRPPIADASLLGGDLRQQLAALGEEAARFELLYHQQLRQSEELERQIVELQQLAESGTRPSFRPMVAHLAGQGPTHSGGISINRGARHGVTPLTIAVSGGQHLVGRVVRVDRLRSVLLPLTDVETGRLRGTISPRSASEGAGPAPAVAVQLEPLGNGTFSSSADQSHPIIVGDAVRLDDPAWSGAAQQMVVGYVEDIQVNEEQPVRRRLNIRPRYHAAELAWVILKIEEEVDDAGSLSDEAQP